VNNSLGSLIRKNERPLVPRQPCRRAHLFIPAEHLLRVLRELNIVWRISIDKIVTVQRHTLEVAAREFPIFEHLPVGAEIADVIDPLVSAERHIELSTLIKPAQAVKTGPIQVIKQRCSL